MLLQRLALAFALLPVATVAHAQTATKTTLAITSGGSPVTTVKEGTEVILTATVTVGGGAAAAPPGQVNFCDVAAAPLKCTDIRLLGTVQLSSTGTAVYRFYPGPGPHSYQATFLGTHVEAASTSSAATLVVSPYYPTTTSISASGFQGNYTLTATVTSTGGTASPTGTISFLDTSNANYVLGTAPLTPDPASFGLSFGFVSSILQGTGWANSITTADFNGDGIPDLAEATGVNQQAVVFLGKGDGTFTFAPSLPSFASGTGEGNSVVAGDFNGDGFADFAVVTTALNSPTGELEVLLGNGDGTFRLWQTLTLPSPDAIVTGDFNGDGIPDLAVCNSGMNNTVSIFLGNGDGSFTLKSTPPTGVTPTSLAVGDFNGDGKTDLAVLNGGASFAPISTVTILLGNGDGTFTASSQSPVTGQGPVSIATGDLNGDGILDLAVANVLGSSVTVLLGNGGGTFTPAPTLAVGSLPVSVVVGDFNGDGKADLVTTSGAAAGGKDGFVDVFLGNGDGTFAPPLTENGGVGPSDAAVADFNEDGLPDLALAEDGGSPGILLDLDLSQVGAQSATATVSGISPVGQGTHLVDASYPGDIYYRPSVSPTIPLTALPETTILTLAANPTGSGYGQQVALTATLVPLTAQNHSATGSIAFTTGSTMLGSAPIGNGAIVFQTVTLPVGTDTVTATYEGDTNFAYATASVTVTVSPFASSTTLTVTPNPAGVGQTLTLTAAVTGNGSPAPTGTVTFYDGATQLSPATLDATGHATYTTATLALGTHLLTAVYAGNAIYSPSSSPIVSESIENAGFTMTLSNSSITLQTHQHTTTTVTLISLGNFTENIGLSCGSLPALVTCIFTPNPAALAGNGTTAVSFYLDTDSILGGASGPLGSRREPRSPFSLALAFPSLVLILALTGQRRRRLSLLVIPIALAYLPFALGGCGSSVITPVPSASPGTYTIPITATGATTGITHTAQITLTVTP